MNAAAAPTFLSPEEYLSWEEQSDVKHEYIGGVVVAMPGASIPHNLICINIVAELRGGLRGGPCRVLMADVKARLSLADKDLFYYPDVMVTCDAREKDQHYCRFPKLIVEVLSEGTEGIDRREKFWNYTQFESIEEYVLVAQDKIEVTIFRRENNWKPQVLRAENEQIEFRSVGVTVPTRAIYEGIQFQ